VLLDLAGVLQDLELDWEYELALARPGRHATARRSPAQPRALDQQGFASLSQNLAEYLAEESRTLVGSAKPKRAFSELDQIKSI
jgi:ubiquinone biosynthesis protein UbiJ